MSGGVPAGLVPALVLALDRTQEDLARTLACLRGGANGDASHLLTRAISRLEMMRMALASRDDGPVLS